MCGVEVDLEVDSFSNCKLYNVCVFDLGRCNKYVFLIFHLELSGALQFN